MSLIRPTERCQSALLASLKPSAMLVYVCRTTEFLDTNSLAAASLKCVGDWVTLCMPGGCRWML